MVDYPDPISGYLFDRLVTRVHPAYFLIDDQGAILDWGGRLDRYNIPTPAKGMDIGDLLFFFEGLLPMAGERMVVECVDWAAGVVVDAHLFRDAGRLWLLLTDAGQKAQDRRQTQQCANDLRLLRDTHTRILDQHLGRAVTARLMGLDSHCGPKRCTLSILFADIRGFTSFCEHRPPADVFETLNAYLGVMIRPVLDRGGIIDKIAGDAIMAVFGILPSDRAAPDLAVSAAKAILDNTRAEGMARVQAGNTALSVGVGIATGPVVFGVIGSRERKTLSVTGHSANLAARLESQAAGAEILIDATTMEELRTDRLAFRARWLTLRGMDSPITAYGWTMQHEP